MTTIDKTGASDAEFRARVAAFDAAPTPPEVVVETVARAIADSESAHGPFGFPCQCGWEAGFGAGWEDRVRRHRLLSVAAAAIAALPPSPAEEAVRRAEAVLDRNEPGARLASENSDLVASIAGATVVIGKLRAALASPAPAPQGGGQ